MIELDSPEKEEIEVQESQGEVVEVPASQVAATQEATQEAQENQGPPRREPRPAPPRGSARAPPTPGQSGNHRDFYHDRPPRCRGLAFLAPPGAF